MNLTTKALMVLLCASIVILPGCGDDDGNFILQIDMVSGDQAVSLGQNIDINGVMVNLSILQFYVGGVEISSGSETTSYADTYHIFSPSDNQRSYGLLDIEKSYDGLNFFVGVDAVTNSQSETDFTERSLSSPLGAQDPQMHWNWNTGYKFVRIDGLIDLDGDGVAEEGFRYHLGTDNLLRNIDLASNLAAMEGSNIMNVEFDLEKLFEGIDLSTEYFTMTGDNPTPAIAAANNLSSAFIVN